MCLNLWFSYKMTYPLGRWVFKGTCPGREKKKRIPDFDHTYCVQGLNITTLTKLDYKKWEELKQFVLIQSSRPLHTFSSMYYILQHGCQFRSWVMVNKISNQTVHHHLATKFASMLHDIKKYQPVKLLIYLLHFWYGSKKNQLLIFLTMLTQTD